MLRAGGILASHSWDAGFRDAGRLNVTLASRLLSVRLASLLTRDAALSLLIIASGQRRLKIAGLLGPMPRSACLLYLTRYASFALASGEWGFRGANLVNLTFGLPNADFACRVWCSRDAGLNLASCLSWTISCSNLQLTRTPPLSALSISVASWGWRETNDDLVLKKGVDWLDAREFDHAGLLRDVSTRVTHGVIGHNFPHSSCL